MIEKMISIWFFVGSLLVVYGVLITGAGIYDWKYPSGNEVYMAHLHASVWWGLLLLVIGLVYVYFFRPGKNGN